MSQVPLPVRFAQDRAPRGPRAIRRSNGTSVAFARRSSSQLSGRLSLIAALAAALPGLGACGLADAPSSDSPLPLRVLDSAGVRIVENPVTHPGPGFVWAVSEMPRTRIGEPTGDEAELFANVRHGTVLSDGRIVIANGRPIEVRVFSPVGDHVTTFGRMGDGPGEFSLNGITGLRAISGDTLAIGNGGFGVHFFSPEGALLQSIPGPGQAGVGASQTASWLGGASFLVTQPGSSPSGEPPGTGVYAPSVNYLLWSEELGPQSVGTFDGVVQFRLAGGPPGVPSVSLPSPFNRRIAYAVGAEQFYIGDQTEYVISVYTPDGRMTQIVRKAYEPIAVPEPERESARDRARSGPLFRTPAMPAAMLQHLEQQVEAMPIPEVFPAFDALAEDRLGRLWVRRIQPQMAAETQQWEVFGPDGALQATVRVPSVDRILEFGPDYILAVSRGEFDVESVHLYELTRGSTGGT